MKAVVVLGVLVFVFIQDSWQRPFRVVFEQADKECMNQLGLNETYVSKAFKFQFKLTEDDPQINDFVACSWNKTSFLDEEGNINRNEVKEYFVKFVKARKLQATFNMDSENVDASLESALDDCATTKGKDVGDFAVKIYNCLLDALLRRQLF